jgi:uncharacterized caspase-like protein
MRKIQAQQRRLITVLLAALLSGLSTYGQKPPTNREVKDTTPAPATTLPVGSYYALVIGNNNYQYLPKLQTAVNDATALAKLLREQYAFKENKLLLNATRDDIFTALTEYRRTLPENSNLLIYYAGHGHHDRDTDEAYWLPVDAQVDNPDHWISANDITTNIRAIPSKHVLIISDSCYSGVLTRGADVAINPLERDAYLGKMLKSKSRNLMSSGGDEPVADSGAAGHSVFASAILKSLSEMEDEQFTAADLFQRFIKRGVAGRSDQVPQYSFIRNSGDEFGDFVFSKRTESIDLLSHLKRWRSVSGEWKNDNTQTRGITRIQILIILSAHVQAWSACSPQDCDWGEKPGTFNDDGSVSIAWDQGKVLRKMTLTRDADRLLMLLDSDYKDGRPHEHRKEYFVKSK